MKKTYNPLGWALVGLCFLGTSHAQDMMPQLPAGETRHINSVVFSAKGDKIAVSFFEELDFAIYDFPSFRHIGKTGRTFWLGPQFSGCGKYLAIPADPEQVGAVAIWDVAAKPPKKLKLLSPKEKITDLELGAICHLVFSADAKLVFGLDGFARLHCWKWQESDKPISVQQIPGERHFSFESRFLDHETIFNASHEKKGVVELLRFNGESIKKHSALDSRLWAGQGGEIFFTPEKKYAAMMQRKERAVYIFDITKKNGEIVDQMNDHWFPKRKTEALKPDEVLAVPGVAVTPDRNVIIVIYAITRETKTIRQGIGFFPRTERRRKEFGLDSTTQSHLFLPTKGEILSRPHIAMSPDGRWLAFTNLSMPLRFWPIESLGKTLLAEKNIEKR